MKIKYLVWTAAVLAAVFNFTAVPAMGKKPSQDDVNSSDSEPDTTSVGLEVLYRHQQCNLRQAQTRWIDSADTLQTLFQDLNKSNLGGEAQQPPPVDFSRDGVLLVAMGQKNTGGYAVDVVDNVALLDGSVLKLSVQWREPRKGMMLTQVLTSPCMLLKIPAVRFERIEIVDQSATIRLSGKRE